MLLWTVYPLSVWSYLDNMAYGVISRDPLSMASVNPGASFSMTACVACSKHIPTYTYMYIYISLLFNQLISNGLN